MYQKERMAYIMKLLTAKKTLSTQEITRLLQVSKDTARRDIVKLADTGMAERVHGGVILPELAAPIKQYNDRICQQEREKRLIASCAVSCLEKASLCFFDTSTTVRLVCEFSRDGLANKSIYTHSIDNVLALLESPGISLYSLGGKVNGPNRFFYGSEVLAQLQNIRFDAALLGAAACMEDGIYFEDKEDADIKRAAAKKADQVIVAADRTKFHKKSKYRALSWEDIDIFVSDGPIQEEWAQRFQTYRIKTVIPGTAG